MMLQIFLTADIYNCNFSVFELFLYVGSYYIYDNPAALQDVMISELNINTGLFIMFYSLYSWPNVILCFIGGFLIDRVFGVRWGAIIFCGLVTIGQVLYKNVCYL